MMKKNVIFLTFVLAFICTLSVVHSQTVEVQGTQYEIDQVGGKAYPHASLFIYALDGSTKNLIKTIDDYHSGCGYDVTNNYLYYANHDNYVMRMSFDTYEIENISIQTDRSFGVTDDDSIICVSTKPAELPSIPSLYNVKTKEEIEIKGFPIDLVQGGDIILKYDAEHNGFGIEYYSDGSNPYFTGSILVDDFTYTDFIFGKEWPYRYYSRQEGWTPYPSFDGSVEQYHTSKNRENNN